jgi:glycine oxidase
LPGPSDQSGSESVDAIIVGGGVIGLACAWRTAQAGLRVRVLERDAPGSGASGVAAGMLAPVGEATFGEERLLEMGLASHALWPEFAAELSADAQLTGYAEFGALHVALDRDEAAELRRRYELMRSLDLEATALRPSECRALEPGLAPAVSAGVLAPHEAAVAPRRLVEALRRACEAAGAEVIAPAAVTAGIVEGERLAGVVTADGTRHRAGATVVAAGAWSGALGWLPAEVLPPVRPVKGQIITLRGPAEEPVCERIVASERVYIVPRDDGRLVVGATVEEMGFDARVTAGGVHELLREGYRALPDIAELELEEVVVGFRPGTPDNVPVIGPGALDGLVWATGHFRNGVLLAPVTARAIAALLAGEDLPPEVAAARPERFAAGAEVAS